MAGQPAAPSANSWQAPQEYRTGEGFDFAEPALDVVFPDRVAGAQLSYRSSRVERKNGLDILSVVLEDTVYPLEVTLRYCQVPGTDLITATASSATPAGADYFKSYEIGQPGHAQGRAWRLTHMAGNWGKEFQKEQLLLTHGKLVIENRRGTSSGPQAVPFFALDEQGRRSRAARSGTASCTGAATSASPLKQIRSTDGDHRGIRADGASWRLKPQEQLTTPLVTIGYSAAGFDTMSEALYDLQLDFLAPRAKARRCVRSSTIVVSLPVCHR